MLLLQECWMVELILTRTSFPTRENCAPLNLLILTLLYYMVLSSFRHHNTAKLVFFFFFFGKESGGKSITMPVNNFRGWPTQQPARRQRKRLHSLVPPPLACASVFYTQ